MASEWLFRGRLIHDVLDAREERIRTAVGRLTAAALAEEGLGERLTGEFRARVPVLTEEAACVVEHGEVEIAWQDPVQLSRTGRGYRTVIAIPFEGEAEFFETRSSVHAVGMARAEIRDGELRIACERPEEDIAAVGVEYRRTVAAVREELDRLGQAATRFNEGLERAVGRCLVARRRELEDPGALAELLGLGWREPARERPPAIEKAAPPREADETEYEEALGALRNMARVMELDPGPFAEMGEEDLRAHFLVQLNARFGGQATGETYNFRGKTDLLVRSGGRNVLIGECKFWSGESAFVDAIDQLLSYLSWRDTRAALLVFYRGANFSMALERMASAGAAHVCFRADEGKSDETTFRYRFANPHDPAREVKLAVMAFDVPAVGRGRNSPATDLSREDRTKALLEVLERRGFLTYEEVGRELQVSGRYVQEMVNGSLKGSGLVQKRRRGAMVLVGLRAKKS